MSTVEILKEFLDKDSWEIDKLKGVDVIHYIIDCIEKEECKIDTSGLSDLPNDILYIAMDSDGGWRGYKSKPRLKHMDGIWSTGDDDDYINIRCTSLNKSQTDWKQSLTKLD